MQQVIPESNNLPIHDPGRAARAEQPDHAYPLLSAHKSLIPPHFRFMWAQR